MNAPIYFQEGKTWDDYKKQKEAQDIIINAKRQQLQQLKNENINNASIRVLKYKPRGKSEWHIVRETINNEQKFSDFGDTIINSISKHVCNVFQNILENSPFANKKEFINKHTTFLYENKKVTFNVIDVTLYRHCVVLHTVQHDHNTFETHLKIYVSDYESHSGMGTTYNLLKPSELVFDNKEAKKYAERGVKLIIQ